MSISNLFFPSLFHFTFSLQLFCPFTRFSIFLFRFPPHKPIFVSFFYSPHFLPFTTFSIFELVFSLFLFLLLFRSRVCVSFRMLTIYFLAHPFPKSRKSYYGSRVFFYSRKSFVWFRFNQYIMWTGDSQCLCKFLIMFSVYGIRIYTFEASWK